MSLTKIGRGAAAAMMSLAMGFGLTACTRDYTVAYVYATTAPKNGQGGGVAQYGVDYQSGSLVGLTATPVAAGNNPTGLVAAPNGLFIYVLNHDDSTVQEFAIGSDGKLTSKNTYPITGIFPTGANVDPSGKFLYVTYTYQTGYSATNPGPGGVSIFPVNADNSLGTPLNQNVGINPVAVVTNGFNNYVYIVDQEATPSAAVLGFARDASTGALTPVPGTTVGPAVPGGPTVAKGFPAGVTPSAIAEDPRGHFVYVTDKAANQLIGYVVQDGGALVPMVNGPFSTGLFPVAVTVDPRGLYLYVANYNANTVSAYAINQASGTPAGTVGSGATPVGTAPTALAIEPALGIYLFVANNLDGTISGQQLDPHNGALKAVQNTPFPATGLPTGVVAVANGSHATQILQP
ncbi:MAG TPA: beta-propeller fold lactonase family protein [Edaphobacter sp.]|nr:beta-propeller fold lactonase family protein [Edaphobacter sp.]